MLKEKHIKQLTNIKTHLLLKDIIPNILNLPHDVCPFCNKRGKWKIRGRGEIGTCFSSNCIIRSLNKHGACDVITAYRLLNKKSNKINEEPLGFIDALNQLDSLVIDKLGLDVLSTNLLESRHKVISQAWRTYVKELKSKYGTSGITYLINRGFSEEIINELDIGYASNNTLRRNSELSWEDLYEHRLIDNTTGREFFFDSIIFPVKDIFNRFLHLQGRSICPIIPKDKEGNDRWPRYKATSNVIGIPNIDMFMFLEHKLGLYKNKSNNVFICEGVPDVISLYQAGENAVGVFGTHGLLRNIYKFQGFNEITVIADNDKYVNNHNYYPNLYKSWERLIPQIITLQIICPETKIYTFIPPTEINSQRVKDINDMYKAGVQGNSLINYIMDNRVHLPKFLIEQKFHDSNYHLDILKVIKITNSHLSDIEALILNKYGNFMNYLLNVIIT